MKTCRKTVPALASLVAVLFLLPGCQCCKSHSGSAPASAAAVAPPPPTKESQAAMTPQQALAELRAGNERFAAGHPLVRNCPADVKATGSGQYPFAVVLSCIDSRQPIEIVLDQGVGDIFSARVAGNVLNEDVLGSMEYACKEAGAKLIAVIGHSSCGAVKGAADHIELGNLTGLLDKIKPAMDAVPAEVQPRSSKNHAFVDQVAEENVKYVIRQIRERSPVLRDMLDKGEIAMVGGMYDVSSGKVRFFDSASK
jgi:carbonic anhydrase